MPILSVLCSVLLLTGETLSCCRINESISDALRALVTGSGHHGESGESGKGAVDSHSHCHGHAQAVVPDHGIPGTLDVAGSAYIPFGSCISQYSLQAKPMVVGELTFSLDFFYTQAPLIAVEGVAPFLIERPRPQNKAGPPVYLTTLRLLV
jgi:hypothetical protein